MSTIDPFLHPENVVRYRALLIAENDGEQQKRLQAALEREEEALCAEADMREAGAPIVMLTPS